MDFAPIFQQVFQTSAVPTLLVAHNGTVLAGSDSLQSLLGYTATDLQGRSIQSLVSENSLGWQSIVENQQPTSISETMQCADGKTELVQLQLTPVKIAQDFDPVWYVNLNPAPLSDLSHSDLFSGRG
jgi:PAS domain S-box-containing protein